MTRDPGAVLSLETGDVEMSEKIVNSTRLWGISMRPSASISDLLILFPSLSPFSPFRPFLSLTPFVLRVHLLGLLTSAKAVVVVQDPPRGVGG